MIEILWFWWAWLHIRLIGKADENWNLSVYQLLLLFWHFKALWGLSNLKRISIYQKQCINILVLMHSPCPYHQYELLIKPLHYTSHWFKRGPLPISRHSAVVIITPGYAAQQLLMLVHQSVDELGQGGVKSKNTAMHSPLTREDHNFCVPFLATLE